MSSLFVSILPAQAVDKIESDDPVDRLARMAVLEDGCPQGWVLPASRQSRPDIDGDGVADFILTGQAECDATLPDKDGNPALTCGTAGCPTEIWISVDTGTWSLDWSGVVHGVQWSKDNATLTVIQHHLACSNGVETGCVETLKWHDGQSQSIARNW